MLRGETNGGIPATTYRLCGWPLKRVVFSVVWKTGRLRMNSSISQSIYLELVRRLPREKVRINWLALGCLGLTSEDTIYFPSSQPALIHVARKFGATLAPSAAKATVVGYDRLPESDLMLLVGKMKKGTRLVIFNDESDLERMTERCFDLVTACIFDRESRTVMRVFDAHRPRRIPSYIEVELSDISDAALAMNASKIASLR